METKEIQELFKEPAFRTEALQHIKNDIVKNIHFTHYICVELMYFIKHKFSLLSATNFCGGELEPYGNIIPLHILIPELIRPATAGETSSVWYNATDIPSNLRGADYSKHLNDLRLANIDQALKKLEDGI